MVTFKCETLGKDNIGISQISAEGVDGPEVQEVERPNGETAVIENQEVTLHEAPQTGQPEADQDAPETQITKPGDGYTM